jgi:hypothetical protein
MKILKAFRFTLLLFALVLVFTAVKASYDSYLYINSIVKNDTSELWKFGFNSIVMGENKEILFRGNFSPYPIQPGEKYPMGHDTERERIIGVYLEAKNRSFEISCPIGFSHYQVEIYSKDSRCYGTEGAVSRWLANLPFSNYFMGVYFAHVKELLVPKG